MIKEALTLHPAAINNEHTNYNIFDKKPEDVFRGEALDYLKAGLSIIPIRPGSKAPAIEWKEYQSRLPNESEIRGWFRGFPGCGIGVIAGEVSANLEIIDIESIAPIEEFFDWVTEAAPDLLDRLPLVETPSGGRHIYYRCEVIEHNQKLAQRQIEDKKIKTLIETRGEGGYVLSPLCPAGVHPNGKQYRLLNGNLYAVPTITPEEREILLTAARACNEYVDTKRAIGSSEGKKELVDGGRPGDDFNKSGNVRDLLSGYGWTYLCSGSVGELWARPAVDHTSATLFDEGTLYVFSTNAHPFEGNQSYSPFAVYTLLKHNGDYSAAAKALAAEGYGEQKAIGEKEDRPTINQQLIDLAVSNAELFQDNGGVCYVTVTVSNHRETHKLQSTGFKDWLAGTFYRENQKGVSGSKIDEVMNVLRAKARYEGEKIEPHVRIAEHDGSIYLDLCNDEWRQVKITEFGWEVIQSHDSPIRFRRASGMLPLPIPVRGGELSELSELLNLSSGDSDNWIMILGWLVSSFKPCNIKRFHYPLLTIHGEQGSAKSTASRLLRRLIDPNKADLRTTPKDERDLAIAADHGRVLAFDNLTYLSESLSNALCRMATGGGFATRQLYTDEGEIIFDFQRPVIINGISEVVSKSDLLDRAVLIYLPQIPPDKRKLDRKIESEFLAAQPRILGALLNAISSGLRNLRKGVELIDPPRMADFAEWAIACEEGLGFKKGDFISAYKRNLEKANGLAIDASAVAQAIISMLDDCGEWSGTIGSLLKLLTDRLEAAGQFTQNKYLFPQTPKKLGTKLKEIAPNLRRNGVEVILGSRGKIGYQITLYKMTSDLRENEVHEVHHVHQVNGINNLAGELNGACPEYSELSEHLFLPNTPNAHRESFTI